VADEHVLAKGAVMFPVFRRPTKQEVVLLAISVLLALVAGDVGFNLVCGSVYKPTQYGWTIAAHRTEFHTVQDQPGHFRTVQAQTFQHGFKRWGALQSAHPKVLILGDAFTQMNMVSNGEEWYAYLERAFPSVEWFVYGAGGYSSLQEYMVLNEHIDTIRPSLILWQFGDNDYANNLYGWDRKTYPHNNFRVRPYLENGAIVYRLPLPLPALRKYSKIADLLLSLYDTRMQKVKPTVDEPTASEKEEAQRVTLEILRLARERAADIPFFFFSVSPFGATEEVLCAGAGLACIPGVWEHLEAQKAQGLSVEVVDGGHWNSTGNRMVGEYLLQYFRYDPLVQAALTGQHS
jgi:hypothetical protein